MSKTLTTYEALKANETKRVRSVDAPKNVEGFWFGVKELIEHCTRGGLMDFDANRYLEWEAEEPPIERWVTVDPDENLTGFYKASKPAHERAATNERVVHLREVRS